MYFTVILKYHGRIANDAKIRRTTHHFPGGSWGFAVLVVCRGFAVLVDSWLSVVPSSNVVWVPVQIKIYQESRTISIKVTWHKHKNLTFGLHISQSLMINCIPAVTGVVPSLDDAVEDSGIGGVVDVPLKVENLYITKTC